jgi:hypothetical protein
MLFSGVRNIERASCWVMVDVPLMPPARFTMLRARPGMRAMSMPQWE